MNDGGVCRTAPATPGLLKILKHHTSPCPLLSTPCKQFSFKIISLKTTKLHLAKTLVFFKESLPREVFSSPGVKQAAAMVNWPQTSSIVIQEIQAFCKIWSYFSFIFLAIIDKSLCL